MEFQIKRSNQESLPYGLAQGERILRPSSKRDCGFTLVEVGIAMMIVAFGLVTVVALIPAGVDGYVESADLAVESQIIRSIGQAIRQTPFDSIEEEWGNKVFWYDQDGAPPVTDEDKRVRVVVSRVEPIAKTPAAEGLRRRLKRVEFLLLKNDSQTREVSITVGDRGVPSEG